MKLKTILTQKRIPKMHLDRNVGHFHHFPSYSNLSLIQNNRIKSVFRLIQKLSKLFTQNKENHQLQVLIQVIHKCNKYIKNLTV